MRVLIVEDDGDTASVYATLLEFKGHEPLIALDGEQALALADRTPVDAVLLDIGLPGRSGLDVCRHLKALPEPPLILAVSGWGRDQDRHDATTAGCDHFLVKPVTFEEIETLLNRRAAESAAASPAARL